MPTSCLADPRLFIERAYIAGDWCSADDGAEIPVDDPATGEKIGAVPDCGQAETSRAIAAAAIAFRSWCQRSTADRAAILERWHDLVLEHASDLSRIITLEQGKPLKEALAEIGYAASFLKWFAQEALRASAFSPATTHPEQCFTIMKEPVGVVAAITPWNFPAAMMTRKCAPALAAGCTIVLKPSELTPFTALALARLAERAGVPSGVLNIVTGAPAAIGAELTSNPTIRKLSFTGSTRVGAQLMRECAGTIKRLSLELGGNAPLIVFEDADLDLAVAGILFGAFRNAGQTCISPNRILVHDAIHDAFASRLARAVDALKMGPGSLPDTMVGPLINAAAVEKVRGHIADALDRGGTLLTTRTSDLDRRRFVVPAVITNASAAMRLAQEETFGPVAPLFRFRDEAEAVEIANATPYGLASYFYTRDAQRGLRLATSLEAGMLGLNTTAISMATAPFGGVKQSGFGREGGPTGIDEYLALKTFHIGGLDSAGSI